MSRLDRYKSVELKEDAGVIFSPYIMAGKVNANGNFYPPILVSDDGEFMSYRQEEIDEYNNNQMLDKLDKLNLDEK